MRKRNHQIIVRLDDEELLMLKGAADKILNHIGYPADKFGVRIPLDCLYSRGLIPPRESLIRFSQYQCRY